MNYSVGIANSVSANFDYDPVDALKFARQHNFELLQLYLSKRFFNNSGNKSALLEQLLAGPPRGLYFHAEGCLNAEFLEDDYAELVFEFAESIPDSEVILHFDEKASLDEILKVVEELAAKERKTYLENYFKESGSQCAEKNMRKYLALFTLANSHGHGVTLLPVLDVPRVFHASLELEKEAALNWCYQLFNYFGNRQIPILLHLIDCRDAQQERTSYCALGDGYIPYREIFDFLNKTQPELDGIILEYEDKINPLKSRENLKMIFGKNSGAR